MLICSRAVEYTRAQRRLAPVICMVRRSLHRLIPVRTGRSLIEVWATIRLDWSVNAMLMSRTQVHYHYINYYRSVYSFRTQCRPTPPSLVLGSIVIPDRTAPRSSPIKTSISSQRRLVLHIRRLHIILLRLAWRDFTRHSTEIWLSDFHCHTSGIHLVITTDIIRSRGQRSSARSNEKATFSYHVGAEAV